MLPFGASELWFPQLHMTFTVGALRSPRILSWCEVEPSLGVVTFLSDCSVQSGPMAPLLDPEGLLRTVFSPAGVGQLHDLANPVAAGGA